MLRNQFYSNILHVKLRILLAAGVGLLILASAAISRAESFDAWSPTTTWGNYAASNGWSMVNAQIRATAVQWPAPHSLPYAAWLRGTGASAWVQAPALTQSVEQLAFWMRRNQANQGSGALAIQHTSNLTDWVTLAQIPVTNDAWQHVRVDVSAAQTGTLRLAQMLAGAANYAIGLDDVELLSTPILNLSNPLTSSRRQFGPSSHHTPITISEIMYHPRERTDGKDLSYIELFNSEPVSHELGGFHLTGDVDYHFPANTRLGARAFLVVARDPAAVQTAYGLTNVFGPFTNTLPRDSGRVRLRNEQGAILLEVNYEDQLPWPIAADGAGHSLQLAQPDHGEDQPRAWTASTLAGGSPGAPDPEFQHRLDGVVISEFLAHTDLPQLDFVELFNATAQTQNLSGCTLSDTLDADKFTLPPGTLLPPGGYLAFTQSELGFSLSSHGDEIILRAPSAYHVLDAVRFGAQANGVSAGRSPGATDDLIALQAPTPGAPNAPSKLPDIVINEIMYAPISGDDGDEYIELYNRSTQTVSLSNWRLVDGIEFAFLPGASLAPDAHLVVARNVTNLLARYPQLTAANTFGNYRGQLSGRGERITLVKPDDPALPYEDFVVVDEVTYADGWGDWADGGGSSLELIDPRSDNRLGANWAASDETQKSAWTNVEFTGLIDNGLGTSGELQIVGVHAAEFLVDNVEVLRVGETLNRISNGTFEGGLTGWSLRGNHVRSTWENAGFASAHSLHVRASDRGDVSGGNSGFTFQNHAAADIAPAPITNERFTLRAKMRWLCGYPYAVLSLRGFWLEASGKLALPPDLGSPGLPNSRRAANAPPAISEVVHSPLLPAAGQPLVINCRLHDPDGISAAWLAYRVDPATNLVLLPLLDDGTGADAAAGDGRYTATIPGQTTGALVAFRVHAADANVNPAVSAFPQAVKHECLVRVGEPPAPGVFGAYRIWMTAATQATWNTRLTHDNEPLPITFVCDGARAIHGAGGHYRGGWRLFDGPAGPTMCAYNLDVPKADRFLGDSEIKLDMTGHKNRDQTRQVERLTFWFARQLGQPYLNLRLVKVWVNGTLRQPLHDYQAPSVDFVQSWYANEEADPHVYKQDNEQALVPMISEGAYKQSRYRDIWRQRKTNVPNDNFREIFGLLDAFNLPSGEAYRARTAALADMPSWLGYFVINHVFMNVDSFGYYWHHNAYLYRSRVRPAPLFLQDTDMAMDDENVNASHANPFYNDDPISTRIYNDPPYRRAYWRLLKEAVDGPMLPARLDPLFDELEAAMTSNQVAHSPTAPTPIPWKSWLAGRRSYLQTQLATVNTSVAITSNGGADFTTNAALTTLTGTAPVEVIELRINGASYAVNFTSVLNWTLYAPLQLGANVMTVQGFDRFGQLIGADTITITATLPPPNPAGWIVINEIMYHAPEEHADYLEFFNRSPNTTFNLSGARLTGVDFQFPPGTVIRPLESRVIADNLTTYALNYTNAEVVVGSYDGELDNDGETLTLELPGATSNTWTLLDTVTYDDDPPWPAGADGLGQALQLLDPDQDNNRAGNWDAVNLFAGQVWTLASVTGLTTANPLAINNATLCLSLKGAGQTFVDRICLVSGTVAEAGSNWIRNADFETPLAPEWLPAGNHAGSTTTTAPIYSGNHSLQLVASGAGSATNHAVKQRNLGLDKAGTYTLSYWYWPQPGAGTLTVELTQANLESTHSVAHAPPATAWFTPGASNSLTASLPEFPLLWLSEIMPSNRTSTVDNLGEREPWLEIFNAATNELVLTGFYLSDTYDNLRRWAFPIGTTITAGERLLVWLDGETNETTATAWHTSFTVDSVSGTVALARSVQERMVLVDYLTYGPLAPDTSYGYYPEGDPQNRIVFHSPSPGWENSPLSLAPPIRINEWLADNAKTLPDPADGRFQDWFELHNASRGRIELGGYQLTDKPAASNRFVIPGGVHIDGEGFLLIWADNQPEQSQAGADLHVNFSLDKAGEAIALFAPDGTLLDSITFSAQTLDISEGRWPDSLGDPRRLWHPTPGQSNMVFTIRGFSGSAATIGMDSDAQPGRVYRLESSDDLTVGLWQLEAVVTAQTTVATFSDTNAASLPHRFYRLIEVP